MDGLSAAASLIAVIQAIQMVYSLCSPYFTSTEATKHEIRRLQAELQSLKTIFEGAQRLLESPVGAKLDTSQAFNTMLRDCLSELESLATRLKKRMDVGNKKRLSVNLQLRFKWPLDGKDVDATIQNFRNFRDGLCVCLNVDQMSFLLSNFERAEAIEQLKLLDTISTVPVETHHRAIQEARACGTCEWILRHSSFRRWEQNSSSSILWLQGSLGTGKTFLTSKVIDHTAETIERSLDREGLAYFYFNRHEDKRNEPFDAVRSWVRQLAAAAGTPVKISRLQKGQKQIGTTHRDSMLSFHDWKIYLLDLVDSYPRTTLILDAMDECDKSLHSQLIEVVEFLVSHSKCLLRLFVSSRSAGDIKHSLQSRLCVVIRAENNQEDIRVFINKEITAHRRWGRMSLLLRDHILEVLTERSKGMFQWASLQITQLLGLLTEAAILDRLGKLPSSLKATYDEMYNQIAARNPYDKALADRAFMWVMSVPGYLTSTELLNAIRLSSKDREYNMTEEIDDDLLLDLCGNLLIFDAHQQVWKFPHASVMEYLEEHCYDIREAHGHVAKACLGLLIGNYKDVRKGFSSQPHSTGHSDVEVIDIFDSRHRLQHYCRNHWIYHIHTQKGLRPDPGLSGLLMEFLGTPMESSAYFRSWYQAAKSDYRLSDSKVLLSGDLISQISPSSIALFAACRFSLIGFMEAWLDDETIPLGLTNGVGDNVITLATLSGSTSTCEALLQYGFSIDLGDMLHVSPVDPSHARRSSIDIIDILTHQTKDELAVISAGYYGNALVAAAVEGNKHMVDWLLKHGAEVDLCSLTYGSALIAASLYANMDVVELLLENGADVDFNHGLYGSALAAASRISNIDTITLLLNKCASIDLKNKDIGSALAVAAVTGSIETVELLLERGADVNLQAGKYGTALAAAAANRRMDVINLLIQRGADVNLHLSGTDFGDALAAAATSGCITTVKHLLRHNATLNTALQMEGDNALTIAVRLGYTKIAELLTRVNINAT